MFSLLKYVEIAITALVAFLVAKKVGPAEMGLAMPIVLYITYANYLALGLNQVVIKNYSRIEGEEATREFILINFQHLVLICVLNFGLAYIFLDTRYFFFAACVSNGTLIRGFFSSYYRAVYRTHILNKNNLIFSIVLLVLAILFVHTWYLYMMCWAIAMWVAIILYLFDDLSFFLKIFRSFFHWPKKEQVLFNFSEGIKLAATGIIVTALLTADRFVINKQDIALPLKGSYQLADNTGMAIYMVLTSVIFYFFPKWIENMRKEMAFRKKFYITVKKSLFVLPILIGLIYTGAKLISYFLFKEFAGLDYMIVINSLVKVFIVLISLCSLYYIALDKEVQYIRSVIPLLFAYLVLVIIFIYFWHPAIYVIPLSFCALLLIECIRKMIYITKELKKAV